jgi:hypothetical protein
MRDPAGDRERMERQRRNRKFIFIFGIVIIIALMISHLGCDCACGWMNRHEPDPPMDLANMREQGVHHEINHLAKSATFLAAYEAGDEQALTQAGIYCSGHFRCGNGWATSL